MKEFEQLEVLKLLNKLISQENTGTPCELARQLKLSRSQVYNLLDKLKDWGAPVKYHRGRKTFYYAEDFDLKIYILVEVIRQNEQVKIYGGFLKNSVPSNVIGRKEDILGASVSTNQWRLRIGTA